MAAASAGRLRSARSVRSTTSARTRRRRRRCLRRCDPASKSCERKHQGVARDDGQTLREPVARRLERRRRETDGLDEHVTDTNERAVVKPPVFGQFSGQNRAKGDTTKRRGDTKDRCGWRGGETKNGGDRGRQENAGGDRDLIHGRERPLPCDATRVPLVKRNRSARPTRIGGLGQRARNQNKKTTTTAV